MQSIRSHVFSVLFGLGSLLACMIFAGSTLAGDRAHADRPARTSNAGQIAQACTQIYRPVCAYFDGRWITFANSCVARSKGVLLIRQGACRVDDQKRVCCLRAARTFSTTFARCRGAGGRVTHERNCREDGNVGGKAQPKSR